MPQGQPWSIKGIDSEARETAKQAARRAGLTVGQWLNQVIQMSSDSLAETEKAITSGAASPADHRSAHRIGELRHRLENISGQLRDSDRGRLIGTDVIALRLEREVWELAEAVASLSGRLARSEEKAAFSWSAIERQLNAIQDQLQSAAAREHRFASEKRDPELSRARPAESLPSQRPSLPPAASPGHAVSTRLLKRLDEIESRLTADKEHKASPAASDMKPARLEGQINRIEQRIEKLAASFDPDQFADQLASETAKAGEALRRSDVAVNGFQSLTEAINDIATRQSSLEASYRETVQSAELEERFELLARHIDRALDSDTPDIAAIRTQLDDIGTMLNAPGQIIKPEFDALHDRFSVLSARIEDALGTRIEKDAAIDRRFDSLSAQLSHSMEAHRPRFEELDKRLEDLTDRLNQQFAKSSEKSPFEEKLAALTDRIEDAISKMPDEETPQDQGTLINKLDEIARRLDSHFSAPRDTAQPDGDVIQHLEDVARRIETQLSEAKPDLSALDERLAAMRSEIQETISSGGGRTEFEGLDQQIRSLADRIDTMREGGIDVSALKALEQQVTALSDKIEEAQENLQGLSSIERGLIDLFNRFEGTEAATIEAAKEAAREAILEAGGSNNAPADAVVDALQHRIGELQKEATASDQRTRQALGAVQETLEKLVQRIKSLETEPPAGTTAAAATPQPEAKTKQKRNSWLARKLGKDEAETAEPALTAPMPDFVEDDDTIHRPIEPGRGPRPSSTSPAAQVPVEPQLSPRRHTGARVVGDDAAGSRSNNPQADFIAAARRAAQASQRTDTAHMAPATEAEEAVEHGSLLKRIRKPLMIAAAVVVIGTAGLMVVGPLLTGGDTGTESAVETNIDTGTPADETSAAGQTPDAPEGLDGSIPPPADQSSLVPDTGLLSLPQTASQGPRQVYPLVQSGTLIPAETELAEGASIASATPSEALTNLQTGSVQPPTGLIGDLPIGRVPEKLRLAALSGDASAQFEVAARYATGTGLVRDLGKAADWYERAAKQNLPPAQYRLGSLYEKGQGVTRDLSLAKDWYKRGADNGNRKAMHNLAVLYAEGVQGEPDFNQAANWFRQAAERDLADSQYNLAILFARGFGVERNMAESYKWFAIAAKSGDKEAAAKKTELEGQLDAETLLAARLALQNWQPLAIDPAANEVSVPAGGWGPAPNTVSASADDSGSSTKTFRAASSVQRAQSLLDALGYNPGPADGIIGPRTVEAVRAFERRLGLPETGRITDDLVRELADAAS